MLSNSKYEIEKNRMERMNKIDGSIGAKNIGLIIDQHNKHLEEKKMKELESDIHDRNAYYIDLIMFSLRNPGSNYKSNTILI